MKDTWTEIGEVHAFIAFITIPVEWSRKNSIFNGIDRRKENDLLLIVMTILFITTPVCL